MYLIKDFCKPFFWQTICLWLQRLCERQSEREIIEEEQMANHSSKGGDLVCDSNRRRALDG
jgi:hypothetical protein